MKIIKTGLPFLIMSLFILMPLLLFGQDKAVDESDWDSVTATLAAAAALIAAAVSFVVALFTSNRQVKAEVEKQVKEKAKDYVDSFFEKELDIDAATAKKFFRKLKADANKLQNTQVWIVNTPQDKDQKTLFAVLTEAGFKKPKPLTTEQAEDNIQPNDIVVFDATQHLTEEQAVAFGQPLAAPAHFFYYGTNYQSSDKLRMRSYANSPDTLVKRLKEVVLD